MNFFRGAAAAALLAFGTLDSAAIAHDSDGLPQAHASYADLNLSTDAGVKTLEQRVRTAIDQVCGSGSATLREQMDRHACRKQATSSADRDVAAAIEHAKSGSALAQLDTSIAVHQ